MNASAGSADKWPLCGLNNAPTDNPRRLTTNIHSSKKKLLPRPKCIKYIAMAKAHDDETNNFAKNLGDLNISFTDQYRRTIAELNIQRSTQWILLQEGAVVARLKNSIVEAS